MPSMTKKAMSTSVSEMVPLIGHNSSTTPAAMAMIAEMSDHQNPGALRAQNVVISPRTPATRNSQPIRMVKASVAIGGTTMAMMPRSTRMMPSARNRPQCSWIDRATARPICSALFWLIDMIGSLKLSFCRASSPGRQPCGTTQPKNA
jgi:hypothetical protein